MGILDDYQITRFAAFANPELDPAGVGYNTNQARIAIGSGGLSGTGLGKGSQTTGQFVPEQQTDFVFTVAGEELGFVGAGLILVLLGIVLWRACRIARETTELYGTIVAAGIIAWFAFQSFENVGMTLGIMPVAGLPLPFVSYGGSSMFAVWVAVGLLQSIRVQRPMSGVSAPPDAPLNGAPPLTSFGAGRGPTGYCPGPRIASRFSSWRTQSGRSSVSTKPTRAPDCRTCPT